MRVCVRLIRQVQDGAATVAPEKPAPRKGFGVFSTIYDLKAVSRRPASHAIHPQSPHVFVGMLHRLATSSFLLHAVPSLELECWTRAATATATASKSRIPFRPNKLELLVGTATPRLNI